MKQSISLLILLSLIMSFQFFAQDDSPQYRLRTLTAEEYLGAVSEIIQNAEESLPPPTYNFNILLDTAMTTEIYYRYPELWRTDSELLYEVYQLFLQRNDFWDEQDIWNENIVLSWLNQNNVDLNTLDQITFLDYEIAVTPRDFNADGQNEWLFHVAGQDLAYTQELVIAQDVDGFRIVESPLPWFGCCFAYFQTYSGFVEELAFEDLNGDGLPEWVLALGGLGGGHLNHGWLYVLQWQDGQLVDLAPQYDDWAQRYREMVYESPAGGGQPLFPFGVTVEMSDQDTDGDTEIIIAQEYSDTWGCVFDDTRVFGWRDNKYELERQTIEYSESAECRLRHGQNAMWGHNYDAAITQYERSLVLFEQGEFDAGSSTWEIESAQAFETYVAVRLALAYSLVGRTQEAAAMLEDLSAPENYPPITQLALNAQRAYAQRQSAFDLCLSMYDTFADYHYLAGMDTDPFWGVILDNPVPAMAPGSGLVSPNTSAAGCDIESVLVNSLAQASFITESSPAEQLIERGITVESTFHADLNDDDIEEWLIWLPSRYIAPLFFAADGAAYHISQTRFGYFDDHTELATFRLPEAAGTALVSSYFDAERPLPAGMGGPYPQCFDQQETAIDLYTFGKLTLWRMIGDELVQFQWFTLCEARTLSEIFPDGEGALELHAWIYAEGYDAQGNYVAELRPGVFNWDPEQQLYDTPAYHEPRVIPPAQPSLPSTWEISMTLNEREYAQALEMVEARLSSLDANDLFSLNETRFYYALTLEALNRPDDALATYIAIYTAALDSAWGQLAALHLELVE